MSAGHRQRGPQEGHSTMEEGEEMREEENEERTRGIQTERHGGGGRCRGGCVCVCVGENRLWSCGGGGGANYVLCRFVVCV